MLKCAVEIVVIALLALIPGIGAVFQSVSVVSRRGENIRLARAFDARAGEPLTRAVSASESLITVGFSTISLCCLPDWTSSLYAAKRTRR